MTDDEGQTVGTGDWISFTYGIPPVRVDAKLSLQNGVLIGTVLGRHRPRTFRLSALRGYVGSWYKSRGPVAADTHKGTTPGPHGGQVARAALKQKTPAVSDEGS